MNVEKLFSFLVEDYGLNYRQQDYSNCYGGNWLVRTYSFYNDSGCFTIHTVPQRGELDFYYSHIFSTKREELCERLIDICSIEPQIWERHMNFGVIKNPFFWWSSNRVLNALAEVLRIHISAHKEFFGVRVKNA